MRRPAPERSPLADLAAFALRSMPGHALWARVIYTHNHDESPSDRRGALASLLWDAAGVAPADAEARTLAISSRATASSIPEPIALAVMAHAFVALGCPGLLMLGQGEEVAAATSAAWPVPPSLATRWPCPPPCSAAFATLVAYSALHTLRSQLPSLGGGSVNVQHINDRGEDRVLALTRFAPHHARHGCTPHQPVRLGSIVTEGTEAVLIVNFGPRNYKHGYRCGVPRAGFWAPVLDTGTLLRSALPQLLACLGLIGDDGARGQASAANNELDAARADLAAALARALVGLPPHPADDVLASSAYNAAHSMVAQAQLQQAAGAPPSWLYGSPTLAQRGCYDGAAAGFPFSIQCAQLRPYSARLYAPRAFSHCIFVTSCACTYACVLSLTPGTTVDPPCQA